MDAHFYIIPESFTTTPSDLSVFTEMLEAFLSDYNNLLNYKNDNKVFILEDVFSAKITSSLNLGEYIYANDPQIKGKDKEMRSTLGRILMKLSKSNLSLDEIKKEIDNNSIEKCVGIISLVPIGDIASEHQIVYSKSTWFDFRRFHLGVYPGDSQYYMDECKRYYPNFFFHENNYGSVKPILLNFSRKIIFHLSALHDVFPIVKGENPSANHATLLNIFSLQANLDEIASLQGSTKFDKLEFQFEAKNKKGEIRFEKLTCEPHLKLCKDNDENFRFSHRIYFHFGKENVQNGKILVAHIGEHL